VGAAGLEDVVGPPKAELAGSPGQGSGPGGAFLGLEHDVAQKDLAAPDVTFAVHQIGPVGRSLARTSR
jgi:hypothetical protein